MAVSSPSASACRRTYCMSSSLSLQTYIESGSQCSAKKPMNSMTSPLNDKFFYSCELICPEQLFIFHNKHSFDNTILKIITLGIFVCQLLYVEKNAVLAPVLWKMNIKIKTCKFASHVGFFGISGHIMNRITKLTSEALPNWRWPVEELPKTSVNKSRQ